MNAKFPQQALLSHYARAALRRGMLSLCVSAAMVLAVSAPLRAEEERMPDTFMLRLGGYRIQNAEVVVRLDKTGSPIGTYVDFNEILGGETTDTLFRMDGLYRFNEKHSLGFSWYAVRLSGSRNLSDTIQWGDILLGGQVDTQIKIDVYKLNYKYSLYHNDKVELAVLAGFHVMGTSVGINASGIGQSESVSLTAPLPVFGLFASYNFSPRFSFYYNYQSFFINYEDRARGGLQDMLIGLEYRLFRNVAVGTAYNRFALNVELKDDPSTLRLNADWNGLMLYGAMYF